MPVYTYTKDFREKEGEVARSKDVKDNLQDIQDAANGLTWVNVEDNSLAELHAKPGEPYKQIAGKYDEFGPHQYPGHYPMWTELGLVSVPVRPGNGVYVTASVSWDVSSTTNYSIGPRQIPLRLSAHSVASGPQAGSWELSHAYNIEANGGSGIVWAYRVEFGTQHEVSFEFSHYGPGSGPTVSRPARVNLVVFVIDR